MKKLKTLCTAFIAASLFVAIASAAQTKNRSKIKFLNAKLELKSDPTEISGILAKPEGNGPFPAVVLLHTCGEMRHHVSHKWPDYLTNLGYVTLTPDSAGSRNWPKCDGNASKEELKNAYGETALDAYGALKYLSSLPYIDKNNVAVMGFSFGANAINIIIMKPQFQRRVKFFLGMNFKAGIVFYGNCRPLKEIHQTPFPVIQIIGSEDLHAKECSELGHHSIKVHLIPGAYHTFDSWENSGERDVSGNLKIYDEKATALSQEITKKFLKQEMSKPSPSRILGSPGGPGGPRRPTVGKLMSSMDKNKDGLISKKEFQKEFSGRSNRFDLIDSNKDGQLSFDELSAARIAKSMSNMDNNKDGLISREEFLGPPKRFDLIDLNKDGQISLDELRARISKGNARRRGGQVEEIERQTSLHGEDLTFRDGRFSAKSKGVETRKRSFLSEEEIRESVIGNTLNYIAPSNGKNMVVYFAAGGQVHMKVVGSTKIIQKKWFFNDRGLLCRTFGQKNQNHCTRILSTVDPTTLMLMNKKVRYEGKILKGRQLQN